MSFWEDFYENVYSLYLLFNISQRFQFKFLFRNRKWNATKIYFQLRIRFQ